MICPECQALPGTVDVGVGPKLCHPCAHRLVPAYRAGCSHKRQKGPVVASSHEKDAGVPCPSCGATGGEPDASVRVVVALILIALTVCTFGVASMLLPLAAAVPVRCSKCRSPQKKDAGGVGGTP